MQLDVEVTDPGQRLRVSGPVDVRTVADLRQRLVEAVGLGTGDLCLDCSDLQLVDATGLGALLSAHRRAHRAGRRLVLENVPRDLARLLHLSRLSRLIAVEHLPVA